jgi:cytochrome P450
MPTEYSPILKPAKPKKDFIFGAFTGHALSLRKARLDFMYQSMLKLGPFMEMFLLRRKTYILVHPDAVEWVLKTNAKNYPKNTPGYKKVSDVIGDGIFTDVGTPWKNARKITQPFFNPKKFDRYRDIVEKECHHALNIIEQRNNADVPFNISLLMTEFTLQVLGQTLFGENLGQFVDVINKDLSTLIHITEDRLIQINPFPSFYKAKQNKQFDKAMHSLDKVILDLIEQTKKQKLDPENNFVHAFLNAPFEVTNKFLLDQVKTITFSGHETSANVLSWTFYYLGKNPIWKSKITQEVRELRGEKEIRASDIEQMPLLTMFLKESMRLRPPAWSFGRLTLEKDHIHGHEISPDDLITISPFLIHHNPAIWTDPEKFDPTRFEKGKVHHPFGYIPFGGGKRVCLGIELAMLEMRMILAGVLNKYDIELPKDFDVAVEPCISLRPSQPIQMYISKRKEQKN